MSMVRGVALVALALALVACTPGAAGVQVTVHVAAGPACPVEREPPDPACADRPVAGAELIVTDAAGQRVADGRSNVAGDLTLTLRAGSYTLTPQPVSGLMGTAGPVAISVTATGSQAPVVVVYDTGIR